jgi:hypothetical protein
MGNTSTTDRRGLIAQVRAATEALSGEPSAGDIEKAKETLQTIRNQVVEMHRTTDVNLKDELDVLDRKIQRCEHLMRERKAEYERERRRRADEQLRYTAKAAWYDRKQALRDDLKSTTADIERLKDERPIEGTVIPDEFRSRTKEGIAIRNEMLRKKRDDLENELRTVESWDEQAMVRWYTERQQRQRLESEERARQERSRAERGSDPRLQLALAKLTAKFEFDVTACAGALLSADLATILREPLPDGGATTALAQGVPTGGITNKAGLFDKLKEIGFPTSGVIKDRTYELIESWSGTLSGYTARAMTQSAKIVTYANAAGFNISDPVVFAFLRDAVQAKVAGMPSDSQSRPGGTDYGEFTGKLKP